MVLNLKRLRAERIACGITQDEMAHKMGWKTRTPYAKRENGIVDIGANEFIKMAKILGYETNNLDIFLLKTFPKRTPNNLKEEIKMQDTINQFLEFRKQFTPREWHEINRIIDGQFNKKPPSCNSTTKMLRL